VFKNPDEILYTTCAFMHYWAGLYSEDTWKVIKEGVELMLQTTVKLLGKMARWAGHVLAIEDKRAPTDDEDGTV
jgi:hypothetical protein